MPSTRARETSECVRSQNSDRAINVFEHQQNLLTVEVLFMEHRFLGRVLGGLPGLVDADPDPDPIG